MKYWDIFINKLLQPIDIAPVPSQKSEEISKFINFLPIGGGLSLETRLSSMSAKRLKKMSNTDPVVWSIKKTRKDQVTQQKWDIVPDLDEEFADLERWEQIAKRNLNKYEFKEEFKPSVLNSEIVKKIEIELKNRIKGNNEFESKAQISFLFSMIKRELKQEANIHALQVKKLFNRPNNTQTSFEAFLKVIVDDILTFDAGIIIKNKNRTNTELAEMYTIPGQDVKLIKNPDGSTPIPPNPAYKYCPNNYPEGFEYTNDELVYIVDNPQHTGYGMSPLEVAVLIITASLYAEEYNLDFLKHANIPPGILNLGSISEEKRRVFQALWDTEIAGKGGLHKLMFAAGSDSMKLIPLKHLTNKDMQLMDYLKWTLSIKCMCYGISPQDIGFTEDFHRTTSEVQKELSKARGLKTLLSLLQSYINSEIVKVEWNFKDVKFKWLDVDLEDAAEQAKIDHMDIRNGVISINERRETRGVKPIEGGDEHYVYTGTGITTSIEESYKLKQTQTESQTAGSQNKFKQQQQSEKQTQNQLQLQDNQQSKQQSQQQSTNQQQDKQQDKQQDSQKIQKINSQSESYVVNAGIVIKTLEEYQKLIESLLNKEE